MAKSMKKMMDSLNSLGATGGKFATPAEARRKTKSADKAASAADAKSERVAAAKKVAKLVKAGTMAGPGAFSGRFPTKTPNKTNVPKTLKQGMAAARKPKAKAEAEVLPQNEAKILVGPYGTLAQAERETAEYMHPRVFSYRSAIFPNPANYGVQVVMLSATPKECADQNPLNPYKIELHLRVEGALPKAMNWIQSLRNRARQQV